MGLSCQSVPADSPSPAAVPSSIAAWNHQLGPSDPLTEDFLNVLRVGETKGLGSWLGLAFKSKLKTLNVTSVPLWPANNQSTRSPHRLRGEGAGAARGTGVNSSRPAPRTGALNGGDLTYTDGRWGSSGLSPLPGRQNSGLTRPGALPSPPGPLVPLPGALTQLQVFGAGPSASGWFLSLGS